MSAWCGCYMKKQIPRRGVRRGIVSGRLDFCHNAEHAPIAIEAEAGARRKGDRPKAAFRHGTGTTGLHFSRRIGLFSAGPRIDYLPCNGRAKCRLHVQDIRKSLSMISLCHCCRRSPQNPAAVIYRNCRKDCKCCQMRTAATPSVNSPQQASSASPACIALTKIHILFGNNRLRSFVGARLADGMTIAFQFEFATEVSGCTPMEFRWVIFLSLWTLLIGPVFDCSQSPPPDTSHSVRAKMVNAKSKHVR